LYQSLVAFPQGFEKRFRNHLHLNGPEIAISDEALFDKVLEIVVLLKKRVCPKESAFAKKLSLRLHFLKTLAPEGDVFKGHEELETFLREKKIADPRIAQRLKWFFHFKNVLGT